MGLPQASILPRKLAAALEGVADMARKRAGIQQLAHRRKGRLCLGLQQLGKAAQGRVRHLLVGLSIQPNSGRRRQRHGASVDPRAHRLVMQRDHHPATQLDLRMGMGRRRMGLNRPRRTGMAAHRRTAGHRPMTGSPPAARPHAGRREVARRLVIEVPQVPSKSTRWVGQRSWWSGFRQP